MKLSSGLTLAYCTNIHRGEGWNETFDGLKKHALRVRDCVSADKPFVLGLRLSNQALVELKEPRALKDFRDWLEKENCLVAGINGFPFGSFHGVAVKEKVFSPDWCEPARLEYTKGLLIYWQRLAPLIVREPLAPYLGHPKVLIAMPMRRS